MRWPRHPPHHHHHHHHRHRHHPGDCPQPPLLLLPPWLPLLLVASLLALCGGVSGGRVDGQGGEMARVCGTPFMDVESSALLAEVVLEGRVRQKLVRQRLPPALQGLYNVSIQVRKQVWKGKELVNGGKRIKRLQLGTFRDAPSAAAEDSGDVVNVVGGRLVGGEGEEEGVSCVGHVEDGATYLFFLRRTGDLKGRYFQISALPVKKNRRESRKVHKILKKNAAQKPAILRLKAPRKVTSEASLTLRCKAKAKPNPVYSWFHNGEPLKSGRGLRIKSNKRGSRLKISKAKGKNAGVYTCKAANALGEASKNVSVKVIEAESIHKPCEKQTFCFNGGSCRYLPDLQQTFCQCPRSYEGKRCEKEVAHPVTGAASLKYERVLIVVGIVIAFLVFIVICIASYFLAKRRRKRWETRKRMRKLQRERDPLLDQADGIQQPRGVPLEKETQTEDTHPPDLPPKREQGPRANYSHNPPDPANTSFHMDHHFPLISPATTATPSPTSPPAGAANGRRGSSRPTSSGRGGREMERRESRSRLKAVSVDDSCQDRPPSWRAEDSPAAREALLPLVRAGQGGRCPEVIEMDDLSSGKGNDDSSSLSPADRRDSPGEQVDGLPGFLSSFSSPGDRDDPIRMDTPPKDNAHAQLKTPEEQSLPLPAATSDYDIPKPSAQPAGVGPVPRSRGEELLPPPWDAPPGGRADSRVPAFNGLLPDSDSSEEEEEEEGRQALPPLHISEEDLNGNLSKADSLDFRFLPPAPAYSSEEASSPSGSCPTPPVTRIRPQPARTLLGEDVVTDGRLHNSFQKDDCGGFLPHAFKGSGEASVPRDAYCFDPGLDSDPDDVEQFMHGSPKKSPGGCSAAEIQLDHERRLRNVPVDQEAIPI